MNGPGDFPLAAHTSTTPDPKNCSIISIIPTLGMSSCRGRAEAFARRLSSKLRTLGTQADDENHLSQEGEPIINGDSANTWLPGLSTEERVTDLQPLRHESDSFFDFDCEIESPGSPVDECEYLRLIESSSNTPHNSAAESGYACTSAASSHSSSTDGPYYDVNNDMEPGHIAQTTAEQPESHICQPHQNSSAAPITNDEVDCVTVVVKLKSLNSPHNNSSKSSSSSNTTPTNSIMSIAHCNGFGNHLSPEINEKENESQIMANDLPKTLPSEGPDIEPPKTTPIIKENGLATSVQEQILKELQIQSLEYEQKEEQWESSKDMELENQNNEQKETEQLCQMAHTLINQPAENGEEVLKIEVAEIVAEQEVQEEQQNNEGLKELHEPNVEEECCIKEPALEEVSIASQPKEEPVEIKEEITASKTLQSHQSQLLHTASHMDTTDDEDDCRPQRVRRCSSLKTGKTPPGTPGRKKIVRFADVLGLDLADIKTFLDEIPTIPKSAYDDLEIIESEPPVQMGPKSDRLLMPLFQQPAGLASFLDIVREKQVSLENAAVTDSINQTITGSVRVRNLDFHKSVHIRYSLDGWRSYADLQANYSENSCDGFSDKFTFVLFGNSLHIGQRLEFAVRFQCKGQQYWDNNYGANYCFQCLPSSSTPAMHAISAVIPSHHNSNMGVVGLLSPTAGEAWCSSFY